MQPESELAAETRAVYAEVDDMIREARLKLVPRVDDLRRLAHADPATYTPQDRLYVRLALLTVVALVKADRLTDAVIYPEVCLHGLRYAGAHPDDEP